MTASEHAQGRTGLEEVQGGGDVVLGAVLGVQRHVDDVEAGLGGLGHPLLVCARSQRTAVRREAHSYGQPGTRRVHPSSTQQRLELVHVQGVRWMPLVGQ